MDKKPDKRAVKTQKALQNALAELLNKKVLRKITVGEVADLADVNRVTFYKHYKDIYDLYEQMEKEILSELGMLILDYQNKTKPDFCSALIDYIINNSIIFKMIFSPYNTGELRDKFCKMVEGLFRLMQTEKNKTQFSDVKIDYYTTYQSKAFIALLEKWVQEDFAQSRDFIIKTAAEFDTHTEELIANLYS
ncbi:MAG: TetR/AcrR family transcriptional regulator [Ruminococcaceae bacterium]|nr:TetR/AcrR family transcriptional regulator [Oscillospiraceae bacterium]